MKRYKKYMTPYLSAFIIGPLLMLTEVFGEIMLPKLMSLIINNGVAERDIHYIMTIGAIMALTTSVMAVGGIGGAYFSAKASICFTSDLREDLFAKVQEFSFKNIDTYSTGSLVTRLTNDIQQIQNVIMMGLRLMLRPYHGIHHERQAGRCHTGGHPAFEPGHCPYTADRISQVYQDAGKAGPPQFRNPGGADQCACD